MIDHPSPLRRLLLLWTLWIPLPGWLASSSGQDNASSLPLWQQGISRWNGNGYTLPAATAATPASANTAPYTVPQVPGAGSQPNLMASVPGFTSESEESIDFAAPTNAATAIGSATLATIEPLPPPQKPTASAGANAASSSGSTSTTLAEKLDQADGDSEPAPLETEVTRWYQYPTRWMRGWNSHAEFGLDGSEGNADTLAIQTGLEMKRKTKIDTFAIDLDYRQASSRNVTTEDNGRFNADYDRMLADSPWSIFGKYGMEWDKFKAFDLRLNLNSGLGYHWIRDDTTSLVTRFGAGASKEIGAPDDDWVPEAVFGIEAERQITSRQKLKGKIDYFPAWENFNDYRLVTDVSWEILLDGSENLSLKLAATDRYDSTPQGAKPNDLYYSMLLLYKF